MDYSLVSSKGYSLQDDLTLHPTLSENGRVQHPDIVLERNRLCASCKEIIRQAQTPASQERRSIRFHETLEQLRDSVLRGCHLCSFFWAIHCTEKNSHPPAVTVEWTPQLTLLKFSKSTQHIRISSEYGNPDGIAPRYVQAITSVSNASETCFEIAASWMTECLTEHGRCRKTQGTASRMPTRLIKREQSPSSMLRIIRPTGNLPYLTVSHCWGISEVLKLTKTNFQRLEEGFKETELPQLYRDCLQVAQRLGFQYLWLDSLCIIQDSDEDWLEEGWRMGDIYRGSSCTIAAVSCADSKSSLFTKYHPLTNNDLYVPASNGGGTLRLPYPYREFAEPLYDRAWVLQERLLSPRTLEYTFAGMGWHCEEMVFHRPTPDMRLEDEEAINVVSPLIDQWRELSNLETSELSNADRLRGQQAWMEVLRTYAITKLTFESDRPHAINGIISVLQQQTGLEIHAGVCTDFYPYSLLWRVVWPNERWMYGLYKCPSWSSSFLPIECETLPGIKAGTQCYRADVSMADDVLEVYGRSHDAVTIAIVEEEGYEFEGQRVLRTAAMRHDANTEHPIYGNIFPDIAAEGEVKVSLDFVPNGTLEVDFVLLLVEEHSALFDVDDNPGQEESQGLSSSSLDAQFSSKPLVSARVSSFLEQDIKENNFEVVEVVGRGLVLIKSPVEAMGEVWARVGTFWVLTANKQKDEILKCFPAEKHYVIL